MGKTNHNYPTSLAGFVFRLNWIFFEYDDEQVRFLHSGRSIVETHDFCKSTR